MTKDSEPNGSKHSLIILLSYYLLLYGRNTHVAEDVDGIAKPCNRLFMWMALQSLVTGCSCGRGETGSELQPPAGLLFIPR
jgi:hypothetical protein